MEHHQSSVNSFHIPEQQGYFSRNSIAQLAVELEERGLEPQGHTLRIVRLAESIGNMLELRSDNMEALIHAAYLHDVGKLMLPEKILLKPDTLDPSEWDMIKTHSRWSAIIAAALPSVHPRAVAAVLHHHERWDGTGYPSYLSGEQIPIESRILAVCDVYDTLISKRSYSRAWSPHNALEEIQSRRGNHFDPKVVDAFLERALGKLTLTI